MTRSGSVPSGVSCPAGVMVQPFGNIVPVAARNRSAPLEAATKVARPTSSAAAIFVRIGIEWDWAAEACRLQGAATMHRLLILGGGFGGVYAALRLQARAGRRSDLQITLVSRDNYFLFPPPAAPTPSGFPSPRGHSPSHLGLFARKQTPCGRRSSPPIPRLVRG